MLSIFIRYEILYLEVNVWFSFITSAFAEHSMSEMSCFSYKTNVNILHLEFLKNFKQWKINETKETYVYNWFIIQNYSLQNIPKSLMDCLNLYELYFTCVEKHNERRLNVSRYFSSYPPNLNYHYEFHYHFISISSYYIH